LQQWFDSQFGELQIVISNPRSVAQQLMNRNTGIALLIMFLSLSGLFIASVNVSNILMSRAMRMKKHVGILMALGSSRKQITQLFAAESLGITLLGAAFGTFLSLPLGQTMQASLDMNGGNGMYIPLGVVISIVITLTFGLLPARQFSKIDPAIAMRAA
jgi:ABC-type antimicrobial peptide transport system permease subunit